VNAFFSDHYLVCNRPLSVWGVSHHSTGHRISASGNPDLRRVARTAAFGDVQLHATMVASPNQTLSIGNEYLVAKAELFPHDPPDLGYAELLHEAAQLINQVPGEYDEVRAHCLSIAARNGIRFDADDIPPRGPRLPLPRRGRLEIAPGVVAIDLDVGAEGGRDVFDATRVLHRHLPGVVEGADAALVAEPPQLRDLAVAPGESLTVAFSTAGNGACLLGPGWSVLEHWGVWSIARQAVLVLPVRTRPAGAVTIRLVGRVFRPPRDVTLHVQAGSRTATHRTRIREAEAVVDLPSVPVGSADPADPVRLTIEMSPSSSPAELGAGPDLRRLGFGLERLVLGAPGR
jgi:hypothetical protein